MAIYDAGMFTVKEINRLKILQDVIERNLRPAQAAEMLGITPRHCSRLLKRYSQSGPLGMNNLSRGCTGNRLLPASFTDQALSIIRERYRDFGPTQAREKLDLIVNISFIPRNEDSYTKEYNAIFDKFIYSDYEKYVKLNESLNQKYFAYEGKTSNSLIPSMQSKKIQISRKIIPGMSMQDFNIKFRLKIESSEKYRDTVIFFSSQKNKEVNTILSSSFKSD
ncbi:MULTISPECIES: helix-turn-helix domain-containing protein [Enterobacter]|uniref:Helix-turn-helix domain-containing protein n=1 Tax=Enterobacter pseudoroggenkampii TaxID=2996112 RepID=A0ABT3XME2_9ENTR|nr:MULTISPECIES: helix-turn-helix domain-containing protein [Enterobacter]MCK6740694.1 helix-turn-helix domain-containing protein [Enterobacter bugandensis]MCX8305725.1 helix-turn-helix domain-containing protein [Enterobacter pseudoroggenkampii]